MHNLNTDLLEAAGMLTLTTPSSLSKKPQIKISYSLLTSNEQQESYEKEKVKEKSIPSADKALKSADFLSWFVHSNIENDNMIGPISSLRHSVRDCHYNFKKKQK